MDAQLHTQQLVITAELLKLMGQIYLELVETETRLKRQHTIITELPWGQLRKKKEP